MSSEQYIQFIANYGDWVSIKKLKIESVTDPRTVMEFLASLSNSIDAKVEQNLRKLVKLDKVDEAINALGLAKRSDVARALEEVSSKKVNSAISEIVDPLPLQTGEKKEIEQFCKTYAMRKALKMCSLMVDYSEIAIPGMKRLKKAKKSD